MIGWLNKHLSHKVADKKSDLIGKVKQPKLCIISLYSYPLFNSECQSLFGGSEVRISLIARELAKRGGFQVNLVVFDHGQPKPEEREGINIYPHSGYTGYPLTPPEPASTPDNTPSEANPEVAGGDATSAMAALIPTLSWRRRAFNRVYLLGHRLPPPFFGWARWVYNLLRPVKRQLYGLPEVIRQQLEAGWKLFINMITPPPDPLSQPVAGQIRSYVIERPKIAIYNEIDADVYLLPGNNNIAAELAYYCRQRGKPYVFLSGSDGDYQPAFKEQPPDTTLYYGSLAHLLVYAIENAAAHIVQNERQAQLLQENYGRDSTVIRNPVDLTRLFPKAVEAKTILWVGKSDPVKRPEIILNLARHCPDYHFTVIMTFSHPDIFEQCVAEAQALPNVTLIDYVPFHEIERYFAQAKLFISTSVFEGFPNTFLQAAKYEVPIVSLQVDPGEMLSRHGCGLLCGGDFEQLKENICTLMTQPRLYAETSVKAGDYLQIYHDKETLIPQYEALLLSLAASNKRDLKTYKKEKLNMNLSALLPKQLRRLKEMSRENREMMEKLAILERNVANLTAAVTPNGAEKLPETISQHQLLEQKVRFLVVENIRMSQLLRELIYFNNLKRSDTGSETKESFDYQWREVGEGQWMPSNPEFLQTTPDLVAKWTRLPQEWFPGKRALDAGCGSGRWTYAMLKLGAQVTSIDQSAGGLAQTRSLVEREGLNSVEFQQKDLLELKLEPCSFDLVWCFGVAHHTENPIKVIKSLLPAVAPGGYLFMMLYAFPETVDDYREKASYEEWRRRLLPLSFGEKVDVLKQHYPPELVHGYFDAYSPPINDLFTWEWIQAFLQSEGFDSIHRVPDQFNHYFVARKKETILEKHQ